MFGAQKPRLEKLRILRAHIFWAAIYKKKRIQTHFLAVYAEEHTHTHRATDTHTIALTRYASIKKNFFLVVLQEH